MILKKFGFTFFLTMAALLFACGTEEMSNGEVVNDAVDQEVTPPEEQEPTNDDSSDTDEEDPIFSETLKVLFVGNSLTYTNDLPKMVKEEAAYQQINLKTEMLALPNYAIIDHWNDGNVQERISNNNYDFVIIQQGPSSQPYGREVLIEYGEKFKTLCDQNGSELVFFMVWPSRTYYHTFNGVITNYKDAASINKSLLAPVGEFWKQYFTDTGDFSYYGPDNFHPSPKGSHAAAKIIAETIF
ncbi:SGNH/GDSL hydrolase family protein [Muricauda sp. CAU 1633]|uniref:SGNH/GDSL hydrolase family protein n=1 Tax=Allomuricauda sp. CAU 1633 TaxID=2816036 RepID=UPI001A8E6560|nr:SGNH/GDSL hydrolase family protein [Muricauda sp. CAU 1633]MBO0324156.1 SGNH/GDSL hydrolase family protein [Muricauda sp. CAU 1633]